ncbi:hypothetical protein N7468_008771 [Penicillium chermesinum]|uniref:GRIP domain-containing protein n=1 Tax=Penicillium chermesinum TaxID=63820 RepID=A0A9W9NGI3_9EURO|nr:uncharacterized protein N7468_008771 [Penicillium chermesinum]KAJ5219567.1 hypothetical protein N7468_008771 [Penicillium chermesinum]
MKGIGLHRDSASESWLRPKHRTASKSAYIFSLVISTFPNLPLKGCSSKVAGNSPVTCCGHVPGALPFLRNLLYSAVLGSGRLRDAIDSRIAEEQARQKTAQENLSRSNSNRRPPASRRPPRTPTSGTPVRGPDPKEFEAEFAIGDDDESSRVTTPRVETPESGAKESPDTTEAADRKETDASTSTTEPAADAPEKEKGKGKEKDASAPATSGESGEAAPQELPSDVKARLRRLDKLESRYHELLKAYRTAHSRVLSIEPFEAALRENTPLTSIGEPKAFTEYLNQMSLKSDMVLEELKRVTTERDDFKKKADEAQKSAKDALDEVTGLKKQAEAKQTTPPDEKKDASEEFFSFDNEVPRLEGELKEKQDEVDSLTSEVEKLKRDLSVTRESTEGMAQNLETATRELVELRDAKDKLEGELDNLRTAHGTELAQSKALSEKTTSDLEAATISLDQVKEELATKNKEIEKLRTQLDEAEKDSSGSQAAEQLEKITKEREASEQKMGVLQTLVDNLRSQLRDAESSLTDLKAEVSQKAERSTQLQKLVDFVDEGLKGNDAWKAAKESVSAGHTADFDTIRNSIAPAPTPAGKEPEPIVTIPDDDAQSTAGGNTGASTGGGKKKNKKKKKGGKAAEDPVKPAEPTPAEQPAKKEESAADSVPAAEVSELKQRIDSLTQQLSEKESAIDRLSAKLKGEEDLKEEIESLREDLVNVGQEHVESKDKIKVLSAEKSALEETISRLEKELVDLRTSTESSSADSEKTHNSLKEEFEGLKVRAATLETDLSAAQQLATTRFKDLTDLRETLQRIQPELRNLRAESSELKSLKDTLAAKNSELRTLETKHEDLRAELKSSKGKISERDSEISTLNKKIRQETDSRKMSSDLNKAQDGLKNSRAKIRDLEEQISQLNKDLSSLREEMQLKTAQHASAQSLMNNMRDQTAEMAMQMKEAREKCDSLEEELADAHRLLSERTREGETMRRLLNDIEGRAEAKVRDFKERMEAAVEERDRAEDEASTQARRRAREVEDLKAKVREAERALRTAEEDKEDLERSQKDWRRRRDELEALSERSTQELTEVREAMSILREQLDGSEKQVRDLEKEKAELRRSVEETNNRLEKLRRSHKTLGEDVRLRGLDVSGRQSSRSSMDSGSRRGPVSPSPQDRSGSRPGEAPSAGGASTQSIDYMYLKNVLLQFMEQRDKNYQKQLIPVLGMLLHFDRNDEQKWMSAIMSSK